MAEVKHVIPVSGLRLAAEYIRNAIIEAINGRIVVVRHATENWKDFPEYTNEGSLLIPQAYEVIQNGTMLEVR